MRLLPAVAAAFVLAIAPGAQAHSGVVISRSTISYFAPDPGSFSTVALSHGTDDTIEISDPTALGGVTPGDCVPLSESRVSCPATGVTVVAVSLGPEHDSVVSTLAVTAQLTGGSGDDALTGGPAADRLNGGSGTDELNGGEGGDRLVDTSGAGDRLHGEQGDDSIASNDGQLDRLSCGAGHDTVVADPGDIVEDEAAGACESVARVAPSVSAPGPTFGDDLTRPVISSLRVSPSALRVTRRRRWARVGWRLSEPASTALGLWRAYPGRRVGGRCVLGARGPRRPGCIAHRAVFGMRVVGTAGRNAAELALRRRGRPLPPGRYRLRARATDAAGNRSGYARADFRIRR